jgi:hypothetical protein
MLPLFVTVPVIALLIFTVVHVIQLFRSLARKPTLGETVVALFAGLLAAASASVVGGIAAIFACDRLLTGEMGEWALVLGPAGALIFAALAFLFTVRWFLTDGDCSSDEVH